MTAKIDSWIRTFIYLYIRPLYYIQGCPEKILSETIDSFVPNNNFCGPLCIILKIIANNELIFGKFVDLNWFVFFVNLFVFRKKDFYTAI